MPTQHPVLIIGAGVSGLTLAQALKKENIPFRIFERDASLTSRAAGWGLTIHWSLPAFKSLLPQEILQRLSETFVNRQAVESGEKGNFTFYDLSTGEARYRTPAAERIRVSRQRLRQLLLTGLDVQWSKRLSAIEQSQDTVTLGFDDGSSYIGSLLVGCDGAHSQVRQLGYDGEVRNKHLPIRFLGAGVRYTLEDIERIKQLDPFFMQGSDPRTDAYLWFSFLDTPGDDGNEESRYNCQIMTSWPHRPGFLDLAEPIEVPETNVARLNLMKHLSSSWAEPFRSIVQDMPSDTEARPINLEDWLPRPNAAQRVALIGDAAHTMVMFRGDGANHAIADVAKLTEQILPLFRTANGNFDTDAFETALTAYEDEMIARTYPAVRLSRQACLDAHDWKRINDKSPLIARRATMEDSDVQL